ncbi:MAG: BPSS1780 family membrane protein [Aquabacterium sp.]
MKLRLVPALQGWRWVQQGLLTAKAQPVAFMALIGLVVSSLLLLTSLPVIGPILALGLMPTAWMGFILASHMTSQGQRVTPSVLIEPWRSLHAPRKEWLTLGAVHATTFLFTMQLADWLGPGAEALQLAQQEAKDLAELVRDPRVQADALWSIGLTLPVSLLFFHTPALVFWGRVPVGKAIFFSAIASWRNLTSFVVYGLSWFAVIQLAALLIGVVALLIPIPMLVEVIAVMIIMWTLSAAQASIYFVVMDCFEAPNQQDKSDLAPSPKE